MSFYYLIASLPYLQFGMKPSITVQDFLGECQRLVSVREYQMIRGALEGDCAKSSQATLRRWQEFKNTLDNEIVWLRAGELNIDPAEFLNDGRQEADPAIGDALAAVLKAGDPLAAEKIIDRLIWQKIEELELQHYFDIDQLIIYGLKLKILERYSVIASDKGREKFAQLKAAAAKKYL